MQIEDIRKKSDEELSKLLIELRDSLRSLRFKVVAKEVKNHQQLRGVKKDIARILTVKKERKVENVRAN